mgnify:CR=1 FL=1
MSTTFDYKDINLIPEKCIVDSRQECDTSINIKNYKFKLPIVPANMECVINEDLAILLAQNNYFYIMHRFNTDVVKFAKHMISYDCYVSISVGVNSDSYVDLDSLRAFNITPDYITIDIAHGHSNKVRDIIKYIKNYLT